MMWFDNADARAIYMDCREQVVKGAWGPSSAGRKDVVIKPDLLASFTEIPFPDETFVHVVFDPPHIQRMEATGKVSQTFGVLTPGWEEMLADGFRECFRVLKPGGTLIFKWCEVEVPLARVLALTQETPLYGHRSGKKAQTHWVAFLKPFGPQCQWLTASNEWKECGAKASHACPECGLAYCPEHAEKLAPYESLKQISVPNS
jgi:SAM-dependent methyltransferase